MKKTIILILLYFHLITFKVTALDGTAEIRFNKDYLNVGEESSLNFYMNNIEDFYGFQMELTYAEGSLQPMQDTLDMDELLTNKQFFLAANKAGQGKIQLIGTLLGEDRGITDNGKLFQLSVKALKEGITDIEVSTLKFVDKDGHKINVVFQPKTVHIIRKEKEEGSDWRAAGQELTLSYVHGNEDDVNNIMVAVLEASQVEEADLFLYGRVYEITTTNGNLNGPLTITLPLDENTEDDEKLGIYYYHQGRKKWLYIGGEADRKNSIITVTVNHLTQFAVFAHEGKEMFNDMVEHWSRKYVQRLQRMDIIRGYEDGSFRPDQPITRAETAVLLTKVFNMPLQQGSSFTDHALLQDWCKDSVYTIKAAGLITGYEDGSFRPNQNMSRAELMSVIGRMLPYKDSILTCEDSDDIPDWAIRAVKTCISYGIVSGNESEFIRPLEPVTRGETAAVIYKLLEVLKI